MSKYRTLIVYGRAADNYVPPVVGKRYAVVETHDARPVPLGWHRDLRRWKELHDDPRTNLSHAVRAEGWLGATRNINRYAEGWHTVLDVTPWGGYPDDPIWRVRLRRDVNND